MNGWGREHLGLTVDAATIVHPPGADRRSEGMAWLPTDRREGFAVESKRNKNNFFLFRIYHQWKNTKNNYTTGSLISRPTLLQFHSLNTLRFRTCRWIWRFLSWKKSLSGPYQTFVNFLEPQNPSIDRVYVGNKRRSPNRIAIEQRKIRSGSYPEVA